MSDEWITFRDGVRTKLALAGAGADAEVLQRKLKQYHSLPQRPTCGCFYDGKKVELVIRRLPSGRFTLASFPNGGLHHDPGCNFFHSEAGSAAQNSITDTIVEHSDGTKSIKLQVRLRVPSTDQPSTSAKTSEKSPPGPRHAVQGSTSLLGLLHMLWSDAKLDRRSHRYGAEIPPWKAAAWISAAAQNIRSEGLMLSDILYLIFPSAVTQNRKTFAAVGEAKPRIDAGGRHYHRVVIAAIDSFEPAVRGLHTVRTDGFFGSGVQAYLRIREERLEALLQSAPYAARALQMPREARAERVFAIFVITAMEQPFGKKYSISDVVGGSLMVTTKDLIPVESSYEREVGEKLVADGRSFWKPLRYNGEDELFPDFVLCDTGGRHVPMEVFGLGTDEYLQRRQTKMIKYDAEYGPGKWWYWIAGGPGATAMAAFPPQLVKKD